MSSGELSFESPSLRFTWSIPDFFQLATESGYSLRSPYFTVAGGRYCLRMYQTRDSSFNNIGIELLNSNDLDPGRVVLYDEVVLKSRTLEIHLDHRENNKKVFRFYQIYLERLRDQIVPDGTLTVLCSVRLREPVSAGSPKFGGAQTRVIPQCRMAGKLSSESFPFLYFTWKIPAFFQLPWESRYKLESPEFLFSDRRYRLLLSLSEYNVEIRLVDLSDPVPERYVSYEVGLKSTTGEEIHIYYCGSSTHRSFWIFPSDLDAMQRVRFRDGHLTVFCCMRSGEHSSGGSPMSVGTETPNEEVDEEALRDISKLSLDLRQLLQKMPDSDACLVVSGKEFRAHQNILRARSTVFEAMFGHETAERESGRVVIDDLDPDSFGDFLEYLYTGTVREGLSDDNAFGLYKAADKYDVPALKAKCVAHMRRSLSVDSFCVVLAMALRHSEEDLMSRVVLFFKENMARIIVTKKWKQFAAHNGTSANELLIKAIVPLEQ